MSEVKITFNSDGFQEILLSGGTEALVREAGEDIASRANSGVGTNSEGFGVTTWVGGYGGGRIIGSVTALDNKAAIAEAENKVLSGAVN